MQLPNERTSMAVSEARKTAGNPAPSQYFDEEHPHPKTLGLESRPPKQESTFGQRYDTVDTSTGVGPGSYEPKATTDILPGKAYMRGAVLGFRPAVRVKVKMDIDEVKAACEKAGIREWKDGREWRDNRPPGDTTALAKDEFCGCEGVMITHGGMLRARGPHSQSGPNKDTQASEDKPQDAAGAPWAPFSNKSRETIRVVFNDPLREPSGSFLSRDERWIEWNYPPEALLRNNIPFEEANDRDGWAAPHTKSSGGPAMYDHASRTGIGAVRERRDQQGNSYKEVPGITIKGKPPPPAPSDVPGPGQHWQDEMPSTLTEKGTIIGTGA